MKLPIGISDFAEIYRGNYVYVDKTLLIKAIIDDGAKILLYTRPRRFGKTINMSMLYHYFVLDNAEMADYFKALKIWQQGEQYHQERGKYPVIFISLKDIKNTRFDGACSDLNRLMAKLYLQFDYLLASNTLKDPEKAIFKAIMSQRANRSDVAYALRDLTEYLHRHHQIKPILLIDEYDHPIHAGFVYGYYPEMINLMRQLLGSALKDNSHLHKGIITGILRVAKESIFSGLNNLDVYTVLSENYAQYFGFTQDDVNYLLDKAQFSQHREQVKAWYDGYSFGKQYLYNPWSILNYINRSAQFGSYWVNTSDNELINRLILTSSSYSQSQFESLLQDQATNKMIEDDIVFSDIRKRPNALWNFLHHTGYLTVTNITQDNAGFFYGDFLIPNKEVALLYRTFIIRWFGTDQTPTTHPITQALIKGDTDQFKKYLGKFLIESFSYFDTQGKTRGQIYHVFVLRLVAHLSEHYRIHSNREAGSGRYDVVMIPKDKTRTGIIFEFKVLESSAEQVALKKAAQAALKQIQDKQYLTEFYHAEIKNILQLGVAFSGKQFELITA